MGRRTSERGRLSSPDCLSGERSVGAEDGLGALGGMDVVVLLVVVGGVGRLMSLRLALAASKHHLG